MLVSSANILAVLLLRQFGRSLVQTRNDSGPNLLSCGTPHVNRIEFENLPLTAHF